MRRTARKMLPRVKDMSIRLPPSVTVIAEVLTEVPEALTVTAREKARMRITAPSADAVIPILTIRCVPAVWTRQAL